MSATTLYLLLVCHDKFYIKQWLFPEIRSTNEMSFEDGLNSGFNGNQLLRSQIVSLKNVFSLLINCDGQHLEP